MSYKKKDGSIKTYYINPCKILIDGIVPYHFVSYASHTKAALFSDMDDKDEIESEYDGYACIFDFTYKKYMDSTLKKWNEIFAENGIKVHYWYSFNKVTVEFLNYEHIDNFVSKLKSELLL